MSRFEAGDEIEFDGVLFRIVDGIKPQRGTGIKGLDLRVEWRVADGTWRPISMRPIFFLADFFFDNEERLFPPPRYLGGAKFRRALTFAMARGWKQADYKLQLERSQAEAVREMFPEAG